MYSKKAKGFYPWRGQGIQTPPYGLPSFGASLPLPPPLSARAKGASKHAPINNLKEEKTMAADCIPALYKDFVKAIEWLGRKHSLSQVFNDFLTMGICSYHETNIMTRCQMKDEANEKLYFETIERYEKDELSVFAKLLGIFMSNTHQAPYSDLLGQFFTEHITKGHNGQFFTPTNVCKMMARLHGEPGTIQGKTVADPACGSGRLLLTFAKINPENTFYGADNHNTCAKMSTLNFFANGLQGEVAWMNTLTMEWYGGWHTNRWPRAGIVPIEKEQSCLWSEPEKMEALKRKPEDVASSSKSDGQQLTLF